MTVSKKTLKGARGAPFFCFSIYRDAVRNDIAGQPASSVSSVQDLHEFLHALRRSFLDLVDTGAGRNGVGVYEVNGCRRPGIVNQSGSRIDSQRCAERVTGTVLPIIFHPNNLAV